MFKVKRMKTAVVGSGEISEIYLKNMINRFDIFDVVGCCSKNGINSKKRAAEFGIRYMTFDEILNDSSIELIVNLTPALAHYDIIKRSLLSGKHVYTEKTISPDLDEVTELKALADEKNLRIGCAPDTFLGAAVQTAAKAVTDGLIGKITSCHAALNRNSAYGYTPGRFTTQKGGGVGFDVGIYYITALLSLFGSVERVNGFMLNAGPECTVIDKNSEYFGQKCTVENEDLMLANLAFENGILGTLHFNGRSLYPEKPVVTIYGTNGIINLPDTNRFDGRVTILRGGMNDFEELPLSFGFENNSRGVGAADMAWAIRLDRPQRASASMGLHAVEILNGIVKASDSGCTQKIVSRFEAPTQLKSGMFEKEEQALLDGENFICEK